MTKTEQKLLSHLTPMTEFADTYFCHIAKNNKDFYMVTIEEKVQNWVVKHGGTFKHLTGKKIIGDRKGYLVKIVFPVHNETKQIMATLY